MSNNVEKRLQNIEVALVGLIALLEYEVPPAAGQSIRRLAEDFFDAQASLGSNGLPTNGSPFERGDQ